MGEKPINVNVRIVSATNRIASFSGRKENLETIYLSFKCYSPEITALKRSLEDIIFLVKVFLQQAL